MTHKNILASVLVSIGLIVSPGSVFGEDEPSSKFRVLSSEKSGLNISTINTYLDQAQVSIDQGGIDEAVEELKKARSVSNMLISYYSDLNSSFLGIDALIPRELSKKNQKVVQLLAKANIQLATIHRSKGEPELAVPLLVDVVKRLTPANPIGAKAYKELFDLGFVQTPYRGSSKQ
tara:strand:+ start:676 stop:1203 length:528 start_codon:yes stop_codon:yes gene_type:complete